MHVYGGLEVGGFPACSWLALVAGVAGYVLAGVEIGVLFCIFLYFCGCYGGGCVCACIRARTHTQTTWVLDVSPGVGRTPAEPEEPSFEKSRRCDDNQQITVSHFGEHNRLHLESSKQNYYIISCVSNNKSNLHFMTACTLHKS